MNQASAIAAGTILGETYELESLLGEGGMGAVWSARHLRLPGKRVAIKVLHSPSTIDREAYARFRREAEIASRIGHPNIVTVHDFNVLSSGEPYLVLEHLDGEDLSQRIARGPLPLAAALAIARQIGSALHAAHKADVVHRDLKPGNVFLVPTEIGGELTDHVKVLDFGISKIRGSSTVQTQESVLLGTPQYMAPEQALGKNAALDARTDLFALGAIVHEMLTGKAPFTGATLAEVVFKVVYEAVPPLEGVPADVAAAVSQALAKDPGQRFADVAAFIQALTGRPLQTLDRAARAKTPSAEALAATGVASTGARGEMTPAIPATERPSTARASGVRAGLLAAVATIAIAGGVVALAVHRHSSSPPPPTTGTTTGTGTGTGTGTTTGTGTGTGTGTTTGTGTGTTTGTGTGTTTPTLPVAAVTPKKPPEKTAAPEAKESLPPAVAADLDAAERQIDADPAEAIRVARHTLTTAKTSRAFSIVARAYCKQGNLGDANAALRSVRGAARRAAQAYCKRAGLEVQ